MGAGCQVLLLWLPALWSSRHHPCPGLSHCCCHQAALCTFHSVHLSETAPPPRQPAVLGVPICEPRGAPGPPSPCSSWRPRPAPAPALPSRLPPHSRHSLYFLPLKPLSSQVPSLDESPEVRWLPPCCPVPGARCPIPPLGTEVTVEILP